MFFPFQKPNWESLNKLYLSTNEIIQTWVSFSNILENTGRFEMGLKLSIRFFCPDLCQVIYHYRPENNFSEGIVFSRVCDFVTARNRIFPKVLFSVASVILFYLFIYFFFVCYHDNSWKA